MNGLHGYYSGVNVCNKSIRADVVKPSGFFKNLPIRTSTTRPDFFLQPSGFASLQSTLQFPQPFMVSSLLT